MACPYPSVLCPFIGRGYLVRPSSVSRAGGGFNSYETNPSISTQFQSSQDTRKHFFGKMEYTFYILGKATPSNNQATSEIFLILTFPVNGKNAIISQSRSRFVKQELSVLIFKFQVNGNQHIGHHHQKNKHGSSTS